MNSWLGLIQQALFFGFIVVTLTACATAVAYPLIEKRLGVLSAATQSSLVLGLCMLPMLLTAGVLLAALLPSLLQLVGLGSDHCVGHDDGHQHFCLVHRPTALDSQPLLLLAMAFLGLAGIIAARFAVDLFRMRAFRRLLNRMRVVRTDGAVHVLATNMPFAFSSGILRPRIFLSSGLLGSLSEAEERMILAHERAHLARRDSLRSLLARALSLAHLPFTRSALLAHLQLASEQACDAIAARQAQDASLMAELLLKIERLYGRYFPPQAPLAFSLLGGKENTLPQRVQALLAPSVAARLPWAPAASLLLLMALLLVGHDLLHDALEHVFNLFTHG